MSWSIALDLELTDQADPRTIGDRAAALVREVPHLGRAPAVDVPDEAPDRVLAGLADAPYQDDDPIVRVALTPSGRRLLVAAHHGAVDGLGLLGVCSRLLGAELGTSARGLARTGDEAGFLHRGMLRLREALLNPPARLKDGRGDPNLWGDRFAVRWLPDNGWSTAGLTMAASSAVRRVRRPNHRADAPVVVALGISRRPGAAPLVPGRDTAYARLRTDRLASVDDVGRALRALAPEPDFPQSDGGGLWPVLIRVIAPRLGSTVLVSNLGRIVQPDSQPVTAATLWPVAAGQAGVAVGMVSASGRTSVSVRARARWFGQAECDAFADEVVSGLVAQKGS